MFDDSEYQELQQTYMECLESIKQYRELHNIALADVPTDELYQPLVLHYRRLTGLDPEFSIDEIMRRHYLSRWRAYRDA